MFYGYTKEQWIKANYQTLETILSVIADMSAREDTRIETIVNLVHALNIVNDRINTLLTNN